MSKTFKSAVTKSGNRTLLVSTDIGMDAGFFLEVQDKHEGNFPICFNNDTAPALALAILEAAGYGEEVATDGSPDGHIQVAKYYLYEGVKAHASITAEDEVQAKLEAEALELCNAAIRQEDGAIYDSFSQIPTPDLWLAVARRAREINKEEKCP